MENKTIGTSYMYLNETSNPKHYVPKSTNNNQTKNYGVFILKRKRKINTIVVIL